MTADWRDDARAWLRSLFPASSVVDVQVHRECASATNWRVATDDGDFWFKRGTSTSEILLLRLLARVSPDQVLVPVATHDAGCWVLTRDQGSTLAPIARTEGVQHHLAVATALATAQRAADTVRDELLALGLPRFDPIHAATLFDEMLGWFGALPSSNPSHVSIGVRRDAMAAAATLVDRWVAMASPGPNSGLDHNDLHLGNVFPGPLISDWGDAVVGHSFASLRPLVFATQSIFGPDAAAAVRSEYLSHWGDADELQETLEVAMQLAAVQRLWMWRRLESPDLVAEYAHYVVPLVEELGSPVANLTTP